MHTFRKAVLAASLTALALSALAVPATAAPGKGTLGIVNGIPGTRVDICVNGREIKSRVGYGGRKSKIMNPGFKTIKIFKKDARTCRGTKLAQKTYLLGWGDDFTIVVNKKNPKWVRFDNRNPVPLGSIWPVGVADTKTHLAIRHAADLGDVAFKFMVPSPITPSLASGWTEGDEARFPNITPHPTLGYAIAVTRPDKMSVLAQQLSITWKAGRRYEYILLGTWVGNAKFIVWKRPVSLAP